MKKKSTILTLYKQWSETGKLPSIGLCNSLPSDLSDEFWKLFKPNNKEMEELIISKQSLTFWGYEGSIYDPIRNIGFNFTPRRQTLMLLFAAIKGEL